MSISYSALTSYGKVSLPSVSDWGTDMNILRDPPKSIFTRKIDKVGETSDITAMIQDSGNRACEAISVYARGINPAVSTSYSNHGNNGGQRSGGLTTGGQVQAFLPYRIIDNGAFRPPAERQVDTFPLSRLPRVWTQALANPGMVDFSKSAAVCGEAKNYREVKNQTLKALVRPTAVYNIEAPIQEAYQVTNVIKPTINIPMTSGVRTRDLTQQENKMPTKEVYEDITHVQAQANMGDVHHVDNTTVHTDNYIQEFYSQPAVANPSDNRYIHNSKLNTDMYLQDTNVHSAGTNPSENRYVNESEKQTDMYVQDIEQHPMGTNPSQNRYVNNSEFQTDMYVQDTNTHSASTNPSDNKQVTRIDEIFDMANVRVQDIHTIDYTTPMKGTERNNFVHDPIQLDMRMPQHMTTTNVGRNDMYVRQSYDHDLTLQRNMPLASYSSNPNPQGYNDHGSREYSLPDTLKPGGYMVPGQVPLRDRPQQIPTYESQKALMSRKVNEQMEGRYRN
jgi:hypothetical protein